jgi:hypothetical protein
VEGQFCPVNGLLLPNILTYGLFPPEHRSSLLLRGGTSDALGARWPDRGFEVADFQLDRCFGFPLTICFERQLQLEK